LYGEYCVRLRCRECVVGAACGFALKVGAPGRTALFS
jgi:hypothetical protein